jgi:pimeloyl-ACP methyl ester carboxylesterase
VRVAGTDIVCLHGLGRPASDWDSVRAGLTAWGEVSAPDLGRLGRADAISIPELRPGTVLVGHSLGAVLALRLASGSVSVRGLVMTSGFYPPGRNDQSYANALGSYARHRVAVAKALAAEGARPRRGGVRALSSLAAMGLRPARFHRLAAGVRVPVLVVHGDADHHVPIDFMVAATHPHPSWDVQVVAGGGHRLHVDQADEWLTITTHWLRELE